MRLGLFLFAAAKGAKAGRRERLKTRNMQPVTGRLMDVEAVRRPGQRGRTARQQGNSTTLFLCRIFDTRHVTQILDTSCCGTRAPLLCSATFSQSALHGCTTSSQNSDTWTILGQQHILCAKTARYKDNVFVTFPMAVQISVLRS